MVLTLAEKIEIIDLGRHNSYRQIAQIFNQLHPDRPRPLHIRTVSTIFRKFRERGTLERKKRTISAASLAAKTRFQVEILDLFNNDPHMSTRRAGALCGTSHMTVWTALKKMKFFPYKMRKAQKLNPNDPPIRKLFCERLTAIWMEDPLFHRKILWSDEKPFCINGCFNRQIFR